MADLNLFIDRDSVQPPEPERVEETVVKEELTGLDADIFDFVDEFAEEITGEKAPINEVSPPGWGHTKGPDKGGSALAFDKARKEGRFKGSKEDMFAIMWAGKNKGDKTHYKPKSDPPKKKKGSLKENYDYIDKSAERVSQFLGDTGKTVKKEIAPLEERYNLLEAKINKIQQITKSMFPGNPGNTIVSGIGNSGDGSTQGGGAVWLWDLDDVSIGTPLNGQYPTITDGDVLKYSAGDKKWVAGEGSGANILEGGIINANGGTANTTGNVVLQATTVTNGNLEIQKISSDPTVKIYGATGNTDFKGGFVQIDRLAANSSIGNSNFTIHGRSQSDIDASTYTNAGDILYNYTSHPQDTGTADAIQYDGRVSQPLDMVNKKYVDSAIDTGGGGIGFTFKGTCDVTLPLDNAANSDVVEAEGNFYINTTGGTAYNSGTAAQNWKGIGGLSISADQLIIWSESSDRWFAGAVENDTTYVKVDGSNGMTGPLTITPSSGTESLKIKSGSTTNITLYSGGSADFAGHITIGSNLTSATSGTGHVGTSSVRFSEMHTNKLFTYTSGSTLAQFNPYGTTPDIGENSSRFGTVYSTAVDTTGQSTMGTIKPATSSAQLGISSSSFKWIYSENLSLLSNGLLNTGKAMYTGGNNTDNSFRVFMNNSVSSSNKGKWIWIAGPNNTSDSSAEVTIQGGGTGLIERGIVVNKGGISFPNSQDQHLAFSSNFHIGYSSMGSSTTLTKYLSFNNTGNVTFEKYANFGVAGASIGGSGLGQCVISLGTSTGAKITDANTPAQSGNTVLDMTSETFTLSANFVEDGPSTNWTNTKGSLASYTGLDSSSYIKWRILGGNSLQFIMHLRNGGSDILNQTTSFTGFIPTEVKNRIRSFASEGIGKNNVVRQVIYDRQSDDLFVMAGDSGQDFWWNYVMPLDWD